MNETTYRASKLDSGFTVGPWQVEPERNVIFQIGDEKHLEHRLMQTLVFLAEHCGEVISREQFFDSVWKGLIVNEEALSRAISLLRTALNDNAHRPEFIQTIPGVGYRLIAAVTTNGSSSPVSPLATETQENSIAVLPFVNLSSDPGNEYFSEGISEEILNVLSHTKRFKVVGRTSSFAFKDRNEDLRKIGKALGVSYVLEGSVRKAGNRVRITAQLINTKDGFHLWSETFDRSLEDIFAVQDQIAEAVSTQLRLALLPAAPKVTKTDPEAYALYLQARFLERQSAAMANKQALELIQKAVNIAPDYTEAWYCMARIYSQMTTKAKLPPVEGHRLAAEAADKALQCNPSFAPAHALLGFMFSLFDLNFTAAAKHYQRALALAPTNLEIIGGAASMASCLGRLDTAIALLEYANARDPLNAANYSHLGFLYRCAGRCEDAVASYNLALRLSPGIMSAHYNIGAARMLNGEPDEALKAILLEEEEGYRLMGLAPIYHDLGMPKESDVAMAEIIDKFKIEVAYNIGFIYAYRGENDLAFEWLEKAFQGKDSGLSQINVEPIIANLYSDPRWLPFLERIGMSSDQLDAIEFEVNLPR
jgi:TolB-like protein/Tfp pilus assembly protein PilF